MVKEMPSGGWARNGEGNAKWRVGKEWLRKRQVEGGQGMVKETPSGGWARNGEVKVMCKVGKEW